MLLFGFRRMDINNEAPRFEKLKSDTSIAENSELAIQAERCNESALIIRLRTRTVRGKYA